MTSPGVSVESYAATAVFAAVTGSWSTDYPVGNLSDLVRPSQVARVTPATGAVAFTAVLAVDSLVGIVALVHHTATAGTARVRVYSDAGMTVPVYDSSVVAIWPGAQAPGYLATRPFVLPSEIVARAVRVDLASLTGAIDIGGIEIARFWSWPGISNDAQIGFRSTADDIELAGGGFEPQIAFKPRTYDGQIDWLALSIAATRGIDFQKVKGQAEPFVFVEDFNDADSWARSCFLARNYSLSTLAGAAYRHDTFQFRLTEHVR